MTFQLASMVATHGNWPASKNLWSPTSDSRPK